ncbi:MAG: recombination protein RecR [Clostridia bacterium]|nr:recombination protein RecR [Clostridia bacterium]
MVEHIESLQHLAEQFGRLQGIGRKTAMRMAFSVLRLAPEEAEEFANAILTAKQSIHECPICGNLTDKEICSVCDDDTRDKRLICVVEDVKAVMSIEKVREFKGVYHVLGGVISPINGITPDKIRFAELIARVGEEDVREVIVATNPTPDGEVTAMYISKYLKPLGVKVTRLAYGIPVGSDLEYADEVTLGRALEGRQDV